MHASHTGRALRYGFQPQPGSTQPARLDTLESVNPPPPIQLFAAAVPESAAATSAQYFLGWMYDNGEGVPENDAGILRGLLRVSF